MNKDWTDNAWEEYLYWQQHDKKTLMRINKLLKDIDRNGYQGIGKPERLTGNLSGYWSDSKGYLKLLIVKVDKQLITKIIITSFCKNVSKKLK